VAAQRLSALVASPTTLPADLVNDCWPCSVLWRGGSNLSDMGIRNFEARVERMVEGTFAKVFRSGLKPVEIARRLVRVLNDGRSVGVSGETVVPNHFDVMLSAEDFERFQEVEASLCRELAEAAREHARDEDYHFMGPVEVHLQVDPSFATGSFQLTAHMREGVGGNPGSLLLPTGDRVPLSDQIITVGRISDSIIVLADPNVSRNHAEIRPTATGFQVVDLGSTNGTKINGTRTTGHLLQDGDEITFGNTLVRFEAS